MAKEFSDSDEGKGKRQVLTERTRKLRGLISRNRQMLAERIQRLRRAISVGRHVLTEWIRKLRGVIGVGKWWRFVIPVALICIVVGMAIAQTTFQQNIGSFGTIKVVGVSLFWDKACTNSVSSIDWGTLYPGGSVSKIVYVRNAGNSAGTLSMSYGNWTPSAASSFFTLTWNCSNYVLSFNTIVTARFNLTVQSTITGVEGFSFTILVKATG